MDSAGAVFVWLAGWDFNKLVKEVSFRVLSNCKLEDNDNVMVNNKVRLFYNIFCRLHQRE